MYPKFTCSCRVGYPLEIKTCSAVGVYIFRRFEFYMQNISLLINENKNKKKPVIFKGTAVSAITLHSMHTFLYRREPCLLDQMCKVA